MPLRSLAAIASRALSTSPLLSAAAAASTGGGVPALAQSALVFGAANTVGFGISAATNWHYHLDLIGTGVFAVAALTVGGRGDLRQSISSVGVAIWATKLSSFLFYRALQNKRDMRLDETLSTTTGAFGFWMISFLWGFIVSLPHTIACGVPLAGRPAFGGWVTYTGMATFVIGLALESAADAQKWMFKRDPSTRNKFCDAGVWQISQHPNWLGNLMVWTGIFLFNAPTLLAASPLGAGWLRRGGRLAGAALSPLFLLALFYAQATDVIANAVNLADKKYGADPRYQQYVKSVPLVLPTLASISRFLRGPPPPTME